MLWTLLDAEPTLVCDGRSITADELREDATRVAAGLDAHGFVQGDVLGVCLPPTPDWFVLLFACARLGVAVAALNTRYTSTEVAQLAEAVRAREVIAAGDELPRASGEPPAIGAGDDLIAIFTTSGTTGSPKLPAHRTSNVVRHARNVARSFELSADTASLCALPMAGVFGFMWTLGSMAAGATCVLQPAFGGEEAASLIARHGITHFTAADNMIRAAIANGARWQRGGFASFTGSPAELVREAEERAGAKLVGLYGASEIFSLVARRPFDAGAEQRATAGGVPISPDIEVRAVDEHGAALPHGEHGELQVRGYIVMDGYLGNPDATEAAITEDGWYRTGDLGYTQEDGSFVFLARMKDSLRLRGFLVDPLEIEEHLCAHPSVGGAQVVGVSGERGDRAVAFVVLRAETDEAALRAWCEAALADFKVPARIVIVDAFPTVQGPNGEKIQKTKLRDMASRELS